MKKRIVMAALYVGMLDWAEVAHFWRQESSYIQLYGMINGK